MLEDFNNIRDDIREYIEIKIDLIRLHTAENLSRIISRAVNGVILGYLLFFMLLFISLAAGYFLASILHSNELGFLIVAGFYGSVLGIYLLFRKQIIERPVIKSVMKLFFPKLSEDEK